MELTEADKSILLEAARGSIQSLFEESPLPEINYKEYPNLRKKCGAFVTLTVGSRLRGCIGYIVSDLPLFKTVVDAARQAAFNDPRFYPVSEEELKNIDIEISVMSLLYKINDYSQIVIGRDGLLLDETIRAVLLPQVAVEHHYDTESFLSALCNKAGLSRNEWQKRKLKLKTFTTITFSETSKKKEINEQQL